MNRNLHPTKSLFVVAQIGASVRRTFSLLLFSSSICLLSAFSTLAQPIITTTPGTSPSGFHLLTFNVAPGTLFGGYDTIGLEIYADPGTTFIQTAGELISGPSDDSDATDDVVSAGGNVLRGTDSTTKLGQHGFVFLGSDDLSLNSFNLAQVVIDGQGSGTYFMGFADDGIVVAELTGAWQIPEPATFTLVVLGSMVFWRRR